MLVWVLGCKAQGVANETSIYEDEPAAWLALVLVPVLIYIVRRRLIGKINEQMMVVSTSAPDSDKEEDVASEVDARRLADFVFHNADEAFSSADHPRLRAERRMFLRVLYVDFGIALGYGALPSLLGRFQLEDLAEAGFWMGGVLAVFSLIRHLLHRGQFQAYDSSRSTRRHRVYRWLGRILNGILIVVSVGTSGSFINFSYLSTVLRVIFGPQARMILSALFVGGTAIYAVDMLGSGQEYKAEFLGLLSAACLHVYLFAALTRRLRKAAGLRLLILRVFKIEKASSFIFSGLMRYWRHFGNHFTIADGSLVRQGYTDNLLRTIFLAFILMGALVDVSLLRLSPWIESKVQHQLSWVWDCVLVAVLALLAAWAALRIGEFRIVSKFTRSPDQVLASLRSLEATPRGLDLSFRHLQALCHKNTWFPAVREFASRADAVLMDLRGFNEERQGCKQEVNFLFDFVPLARLLFLVDSANDAEVLGGMFLDRWERLSRESPNLEVSEPVIHLFEVLDNDERNMQAILDRLLLIADPPGGV